MNNYPVATIDPAALRHNLQCVKQCAPNSRVMAVIKADAYGHGVLTAAEALAESDAFAVARIHEGVQLRQAGYQQPIVVLDGANDEEAFYIAAEYALSPLFHQQEQLQLFNRLRLPNALPFNWLMVDSGMHRLGIRPEHSVNALQLLADHPDIDGEVNLLTHFANADSEGDKRNQQQLKIMLALKQQTGRALCLANSAAVLSLTEAHQDWVRPGLMLYGISPFADRDGHQLGLKPAMTLTTRLISTYQLKAGEQVGYGGSWTAEKDCRIGVASIGYGDGYQRHLSNKARVLIHDKVVPVIGRISMDSICLLLDELPYAQSGDEVIIWGSTQLPVEQVANLIDTIPYELVTGLTPRVRREQRHG